jgi:MinD-like ATPase involved in chromosome partitioning or flagellar assembly
LAHHEQDQTPGTGPAGIGARDSEDEGTFRWPTAGLPKLFGRQSAEEEAELPDSATGGTPPAGQAADRQHALGTAPPPNRAPFSRAAYGHLLVPSPAPEAGEGEQPPWPPAPPPSGTAQQAAPPPTAEALQPAGAAPSVEDAETAEPVGAGPVEAGPVEAAEPEEAGAAGAADPAQAQGQAGGPAPTETQEQAAGLAPARPVPAEAHSPAEVYGTATAYGPEEYDPPDGYPMAEYDTGAAAVPPVEPVPATEPAPPAEPVRAVEPVPATEPAPPAEPVRAVEPVPATEPAPPAEPVRAVEPVPPPPDPSHWQHAETADSLTADLLLPGRHAAPPSGWRRALYQVTGGLVRPRLSAAEMRRRELVARACTPVAGGHYRVAVLSLKGGVGKTTTVMGLGSTLASLRGDRVIAVDANPDRGTLSDKLRLETAATVRDLLNEREQIQRYADVRAFTTQAASRLEVLASDRDPTVSVAFSDQDYEDVSQVLEHYYSICITDCGTGLLHSAMAGVLRLADQIVLVSSPSVDGARSASATLDWLQAHGYGDLVRDGVVVLAVVRPRSKSSIDLGRLEQHFATRCRAVVRVPYDAHLEEGAEVELNQLSKTTADAYLALAAEVGDGFSWPQRAAADA